MGNAVGRPQAYDEHLIRETIELLYFAYRAFTGDADTLLANYQFGRAHHRVIYFVARNPGITVSELLDILKITKQSIAPVLKELMEGGFVVQRADPSDRRKRLLFLTPEAIALERNLTDCQATRLTDAYATIGPEAGTHFRDMLRAMIDLGTVMDQGSIGEKKNV
jgi:DNA-binding MarR family transcriptional regulator